MAAIGVTWFGSRTSGKCCSPLVRVPQIRLLGVCRATGPELRSVLFERLFTLGCELETAAATVDILDISKLHAGSDDAPHLIHSLSVRPA